MILPLIYTDMEAEDQVAVLERKMVRTRALHKELNRILDAEYVAGMAYDPKSLNQLILRKRNCVNRFEHLVRAISEQLRAMAGREIPSTMPRTLVNRVKMIPNLTSEQKELLFPLARDLENRHRELMNSARRNGVLFKGVLDRLHAASSYVHQGRTLTP